MLKLINVIANTIFSIINALVNRQVLKYYVKKNGHWDVATAGDLMFFKEDKMNMPKKRGDLLQTNTWRNHLLVVFFANENDKDIRYTLKQLQKAEKRAPEWLRKSSMEPIDAAC